MRNILYLVLITVRGEAGIERCLMDKHLDEDCPLHMKHCEFAYAGCTHCSSGSDMLEHLAKNMQYHLSLLANHCHQLTESFSSKFQGKMVEQVQTSDARLRSLQADLKESQDTVSLLQSKVETLEDEIDDLKVDSAQLKSVVFVTPVEFIMLEFRKLSSSG